MTIPSTAAPALRRSLAAAAVATSVAVSAAASSPQEEISSAGGNDPIINDDSRRNGGSTPSQAVPTTTRRRNRLLQTLALGSRPPLLHVGPFASAPCECDAAVLFRAGSGPSSSGSPSVTVTVRDSRTPAGSEETSVANDDNVGDEEGGGEIPTVSSRRRLQRRRTISLLQSSATHSDLASRYDVDPIPLGEGAYGEVFLATDRRTGEELALKKIWKDRTNKVEFQREMNTLMFLRRHGGHPNICMLRENFDEPKHYVLMLDLIRGGELFDHLIENGAYSEADAARLVREVASALDFCHAIGIVHADLKPENLMLSSRKGSAATIKIVDFGCSEIMPEYDDLELRDLGDDASAELNQARRMSPGRLGGSTPAYCPPESFADDRGVPINPSVDMWSLGIIIYIMLTGVHPFDVDGTASDEQIEKNIRTKRSPPLHGSPLTAHLSPSALNLLSQLFNLDPSKRLTAHEMLQHPWVLGRTASHDVIGGSAKRLSRFRRFKTKLERTVFEEFVNWSDDESRREPGEKGKGLLERAFGKLDKKGRGELRPEDLLDDVDGGGKVLADAESGDSLCLSGFSDLLGENMKQKFFPRGHVVFNEGDYGDRMYFINSGSVHVSTKDGFTAKLGHGDTFGEGGILESHKKRSATIKCATPVHAIEIDEECFRRYLERSDSVLALRIREKVNARRFGRAEQLISRQEGLGDVYLEQGGFVFEHGEDADALYVLEEGLVDVVARNGSKVCSLKAGDLFGFQSFVIGRPRKASAACVSGGGCKLKRMGADDFRKLLEMYPNLKGTLRELGLRREFQRAVVLKTERSFPSDLKASDLREAFDEIDTEKKGTLNAAGVKELCSKLDKPLTDSEVQELFNSIDLNGSGDVDFDEFKSVFGWPKKKYN